MAEIESFSRLKQLAAGTFGRKIEPVSRGFVPKELYAQAIQRRIEDARHASSDITIITYAGEGFSGFDALPEILAVAPLPIDVNATIIVSDHGYKESDPRATHLRKIAQAEKKRREAGGKAEVRRIKQSETILISP